MTSQYHRPCKFFSIFLRGLIYVVSEGIPFYKVIAVQCLWKSNNWTPTLLSIWSSPTFYTKDGSPQLAGWPMIQLKNFTFISTFLDHSWHQLLQVGFPRRYLAADYRVADVLKMLLGSAAIEERGKRQN